MKVGDLVRDKDVTTRLRFGNAQGDIGIILKIDEPEGVYKVMFNNGSEWLTEMYLELISESR